MTKDQIALDITNDMKATMRSETASFQADNKFAADLAKEIVTKESVLQFCGEGFSTAIFSLANLWNYTDLITSAGEKGLYMYLCFAVINDGISYMGIGDTYFEEMNKILDKKALLKSCVLNLREDPTIKIDDVSILEYIVYEEIKESNSETDTKKDS